MATTAPMAMPAIAPPLTAGPLAAGAVVDVVGAADVEALLPLDSGRSEACQLIWIMGA
jgi:hypothetical protein